MTLAVVQTLPTVGENAGGPVRTVGALSTALARRGARVAMLAAPAPAGVATLVPDPAVVPLRLIATQRCLGFPVYPELGRVLAADRPSLLHDNGIWSPFNIAAVGAARRLGLQYVISPHGMLEPWALNHHRTRKRVAWRAYQRRDLAGAAGLLATAEPERAAIRTCGLRGPVATIANGVDVPTRAPGPGGGAVRRLLFMSRLHPKKNVAGLLAAWAQIAGDPRFAAWVLRIAGPDEGGHRSSLQATSARLGIEGRVDFVGAVAEADKYRIFAEADVFILPSFSENFGIVVTEALAHGIPVIATHGTPWSELPSRGCGWWVAPEPRALRAAIEAALLIETTERAAMGARGRAWVAATFGWDGIAARTAVFYEWLLHGGARPDYVDV